MNAMTKIIYQGRLAAVVLADEAILTGELPPSDERTVKAMCLYALEIAAGRQPGPYTDHNALAYARRAPRPGTT